MKLATTTGDFSRYVTSNYDAVKYISEAGFKYIDYSFEIDSKHKSGIFSDNPDGFIKSIKDLAESLGVNFVQAHSLMGTPLIYDEKNDDFIEETRKCIIACGKLGIKNIVVHTGYRMGLEKEGNFKENKEFFLKLLDTAEEYNVNILAENFNRMCLENLWYIDNVYDLSDFISYVNHPRLHACWDAGHGNMLPTSQDEAMRILGDEVYGIHVQDNDGNTDFHIPPYYGTLDVNSLVKGLKEINYKGYFTFEATNIFPNVPGVKEKPSAVPLALRIEAEKFLYQIGKTILSENNIFEE